MELIISDAMLRRKISRVAANEKISFAEAVSFLLKKVEEPAAAFFLPKRWKNPCGCESRVRAAERSARALRRKLERESAAKKEAR